MSNLPLFDYGTENGRVEEESLGSVPDLASPDVLSVTELTRLIKRKIESQFRDLVVCGEISNLSRPRSGHLYFDIKDEGARLRSVLWKGKAAKVAFDLENGLAVRVSGRIEVYPPQGAYQLIVTQIEPEGIGPLELAYRQLCDRLRVEGLFDPTRKRPLPKYPKRVAVVSSPTGAAIRDILTVTRRRWPLAEVWVSPAKVQGEGAGSEIAAAIELINRCEGLDLVIVARGGGSLEDLWAFNEERVARAIANSKLPVITGIGHETDQTIADLVADLRAPTPSGAAEIAVPDLHVIHRHLDQTRAHLVQTLQRFIVDANTRIQTLVDRGSKAMEHRLERLRNKLAALSAQLDALSPLRVLGRGYSLTRIEHNTQLLRSSRDVMPGTLLRTTLAEGTLLSRVEASSVPALEVPGCDPEPPTDSDGDQTQDRSRQS